MNYAEEKVVCVEHAGLFVQMFVSAIPYQCLLISPTLVSKMVNIFNFMSVSSQSTHIP